MTAAVDSPVLIVCAVICSTTAAPLPDVLLQEEMSALPETKVIIFYDIPSTVPGKAWSPNTWKTR